MCDLNNNDEDYDVVTLRYLGQQVFFVAASETAFG